MELEEATASQFLINGIKVFTLNCWGLRFISHHRSQRIKVIAQHLNDHDYDIVFLQEVWCQADFDYIKETTQIKYPFAYMFKNPSILGTSGLVTLVTWKPTVIHFHPFSVNGTPFRPWHGDWFACKGVGYVRIDIKHLTMHLFCTHMHAQYSKSEDPLDQYSIHRISQSYELAKFINLMTHTAIKSENANLILLAGDLNSSSNELAYKLLVSLTNLKDCYHPKISALETKEMLESEDIESFTDNESDKYEHSTSGHRSNSFTNMFSLSEADCKRIDYIMYNLVTPKTKAKHDLHNKNNLKETSKFCKIERFKCISKCPESGLSFSDHEPVSVKLNVSLELTKKVWFCSSCNQSSNEEKKEPASKLSMSGESPGNSCNNQGSELHGLVDKTMVLAQNNVDFVLSEPKEAGSKCAKRSLQMKSTTNNGNSNETFVNSKSKNILEDTKNILIEYFKSKNTVVRLLLFYLFFIALFCLFFTFLVNYNVISKFWSLFVLMAFLLTLTGFLFLSILHYRCEKNAIKSIIYDIDWTLSITKPK